MKKDFNKFSSRSKTKAREKRELLKIAEEINIGTKASHIKFTDEPYKRKTQKSRNISAEGIYSEASGGFGFVAVEGEDKDIFIPEGSSLDALDGDRVKIVYHKFLSHKGDEKTEGRVTSVIEYGRKFIIGTVETDLIRMGRRRINALYVLPDDGKIKKRIFLKSERGINIGDKVKAKLIRDPDSYTLYADVITNFGDSESKEANYEAILSEYEIDTNFSKEELEAALSAAAEPISQDGRKLRDELIFTIDSESAKDLDDAISLKCHRNGTYTLGVHIADVSHYVKEKTVLDRLVMKRGTSVYFTDKVVPMLPPSLSNGACSLNPGEDKYALSAIITLDSSGNILSTSIEKSVIRSYIKGIYSEINKIFEGIANGEILCKYKECIPTLKRMHALYEILSKKSKIRGSVDLESAEAEIILNEYGMPSNIVRRERGDAEKMIEQFMLTANEGVATLLLSKEIPCVFRVHDAPPEDKMENFISYAHNLGFDTSFISAEKCAPKDLARLIDKASERGIGEAVSYACLRSMAKAEYSDIHKAHFGLAIENYCHFTSPIRRLSDLATHRIIHRVLFDGKTPEKYRSYAKRAAAAATEGEIRALNAERRIENLYKTIYMSEKVGEVYPAMISSITSFGIFATLGNTCEGLIPISQIPGSFIFDEKNMSLRSSKTVFHIGDKIIIKVEEADMLRGKLRFSLEGVYEN